MNTKNGKGKDKVSITIIPHDQEKKKRDKLFPQGVITFDTNIKTIILDSLGFGVDKEGYITAKDNKQERVLSHKGEPIKVGEWAGIVNGIHVKNDLCSLIEFLAFMDDPDYK